MRSLRTAPVLLAFAASSPFLVAQSAKNVSFERQVLPILQESCMQCHKGAYRDSRGRTRRPKAGLRLDGSAWMLAGGESGPAVVPGKPDDSPLYVLASLDPDDPDVMPYKGEALSKAQLVMIRRWIEQGAAFGAWTGAAGPAASVVKKAQEDAKPAVLSTSRIEVWRKLGEGLKPPLAQAVARAAGNKCQVEAIVPGSPLLRVAFVSNESSVGDRNMQRLSALTQHITKLTLAKTKVTDASLRAVARMKRLTRLDLNRTQITDEGLRLLSGLR